MLAALRNPSKLRFVPLLVSLTACFGPFHAAWADQCAYVSEAVARRAVASLEGLQKVAEFCEPCGDKRPGLRMYGRAVAAVVPDSPEYWEVSLEDAVIVGPPGGSQMEASLSGKVAVDLAYVFVPLGFGDWKNLALLAHCPTTGVSPSIPEPVGADRLKVGDKPEKKRHRRRRSGG